MRTVCPNGSRATSHVWCLRIRTYRLSLYPKWSMSALGQNAKNSVRAHVFGSSIEHANVAVPLSNPGRLHRFVDPDAGDTLLVVTAPPPMRGFVKRQDFDKSLSLPD